MIASGFLRDVAVFNAAEVSGRPAHEDIVYVLPNKRSAMFLKEYIHGTMTKPGRMPRLMTMRSFLSRFSDYHEAPARNLMFLLYKSYRTVMKRNDAAARTRPFDSFVFWGDMIINDFDEIDKSMVCASELFRNLRDIKEIQSDYLDDDQKEIVRRIWGESRLTGEADRFWLHIGDDVSDNESVTGKFVYLWSVLSELYTEYKAQLKKEGMASIGDHYRQAVDAVERISPDDLPAHTHYAFVGFNDASVAETIIFDRLRRLGIASFFWDTSVIRLFGDKMGRPVERLKTLTEAFPAPDEFVTGTELTMPVIDVYAVPSNMEQVKHGGFILSGWLDKGAADGSDAINTAVVLPDQDLLLPLMFSVPESIKAINVSMGLSYRSTTFATLLQSIISMQMRARLIHGRYHFYYEDVAAVLNHPHIRFIDSGSADAILDDMKKRKLFNIDTEDLAGRFPAFQRLFTAVHDLGDVDSTASYLLELFRWLSDSFTERYGNKAVQKSELRILDYFTCEVEALAELARKYNIDMADRTFMRMFEKMLDHAGLPLNGTPLRGLQVLGVLETRALDFENVAVMSMNERIFPRRQYVKTMIPNSLRRGFGLPEFESLEWTYAYCFYRLIARARRVALFYDSRTGKVGGGEMSRYITQMMYLMPELTINHHMVIPGASSSISCGIEIAKDDEVLGQLARLRAGGSLSLSASALKTYKKCPLQFYLQYVRCMRGDDEVVDYLSAADYGTMVHDVIQKAFRSFGDVAIGAAELEHISDSENPLLKKLALDEVLEHRYQIYRDRQEHLPAEARIASEMIAEIARSDIRAEAEAYCSGGATFSFVGAEVKIDRQAWYIEPGLSVNWKMSIDRVDRTDIGLRFIDFKTGGDDLGVKTIDGLFGHDYKKDGIFQILAYCETYRAIVDKDAVIEPYIHPTRQLSQSLGISRLSIGGRSIYTYDRELEADFRPLLHALVKEIFDPAVPFRQCEDPECCKFCPFLATCGRVVPEF